MGGVRKRLSSRRLAARPNQVVRAVVFLDQAGVDGRRERGIVQCYRQVRPFRLADFLPGRANVVAARRLDAIVGSVFATFVAGDKLDFDVKGQSTNSASETVVVCGEGADVSHGIYMNASRLQGIHCSDFDG